jgi:hypothetical protein
VGTKVDAVDAASKRLVYEVVINEDHATPTGTGSESVRRLRAPHGERLRFTRRQRSRCTGLTTTQSSPTDQPACRGRRPMVALLSREPGGSPVGRHVSRGLVRWGRDGALCHGAVPECKIFTSGRHVRTGLVRLGGVGFLRDGNGAGQLATGPITRHRPPCPRAGRAM